MAQGFSGLISAMSRGARGRRKVAGHPVRVTLGINVKRYMEERRVSAPDIGLATGMSRRTVNRLLNAEVGCQIDTLGAIADYLGVNPFELLLERPSKEQAPSTRRLIPLLKNDNELLGKTGLVDKAKAKKKG